jgi:hypothetical protein
MERIKRLIAKHAVLIDACGLELATNYECPAPRIIRVFCDRMGITRTDWEKITAVKNGWKYEPVPEHLLARWASY